MLIKLFFSRLSISELVKHLESQKNNRIILWNSSTQCMQIKWIALVDILWIDNVKIY